MQKLKIHDLSIGDWVQWNGKAYRVCLIDGVSLTVELAEVLGGTIEVAIDELSGIPITPEILEKNGFSFKDFAFGETTMLGRHIRLISVSPRNEWWCIHVSIRKAGGHDFWDMVFGVDFIGQFVHELQHAIRLAGIEKEIEL